MNATRRSLLKALLAITGGAAAARLSLRALGPRPLLPARDPARLRYLSPRQAATVEAAALAVVGPAGLAAAEAGWDPAVGFEGLLSGLAPDQRDQLLLGLGLFEEWTLGFSGFSRLDPEEQAACLQTWRDSGLALRRSIWGALHAGAASGFGSNPASWAAFDYDGPCVASAGHPGRPPGQTARFAWDEVVP